jgi:hypothetical protein
VISNAHFTDGGWVQFEVDGQPPIHFIRFVEAGTGRSPRLVVEELYIVERLGGTPLPISRIEKWANAPSNAELIRESLDRPGMNIRGSLENGMRKRAKTAPRSNATSRVPKLRAPTSTHIGDAYYRRVAETYGALVQTSTRPVVELAEMVGKPTATVRGWIREARRRGYLSAGKQGTAG